MESKNRPMQIDIDSVLRERAPGYHRFIPRFIIHTLEKTICQDGLNQLLSHNADRTGVDFCRGVIDDLNVSHAHYSSH